MVLKCGESCFAACACDAARFGWSPPKSSSAQVVVCVSPGVKSVECRLGSASDTVAGNTVVSPFPGKRGVVVMGADDYTFIWFREFVNAAAQKAEVDDLSDRARTLLADAMMVQLCAVAREIHALLDHAGRTRADICDVVSVLARYRDTPRSLIEFVAEGRGAGVPAIGVMKYPVDEEGGPLPVFRAANPVGACVAGDLFRQLMPA